MIYSLLYEEKPNVEFGTIGWFDELKILLTEQHGAIVKCKADYIEQCKSELIKLTVEPIEIGYQLFYPIIDRIDIVEGVTHIHFSIREFSHP